MVQAMTDRAAGPFTAGKCMVVSDDDYDGAAVFEASGEPFCFVTDDIAIGGRAGAIARATRIAESLNWSEGHPTADVWTQADRATALRTALLLGAFGGMVATIILLRIGAALL